MMVGEPTPMGMFPEGSTPEGVADMAGNVWEWTRSDYDQRGNKVRVLRGGSFSYGSGVLRAANRVRNEPDDRNYGIGFRCVRE
jgi:formylglycine-generating enzyme required for sulfatase activity